MKCVLIFLFIAAAYAGDEGYYRRLDALKQEAPCSAQGGICTFAADCDNVLGEGLCPAQRSQGVECCSGVSNKEQRCRNNGGECMDNCNPRLRVNRADDCPVGTNCCVLV
ncbi:hypothetical protein ACJJTC_017887 [Scirpophaga incertulas]